MTWKDKALDATTGSRLGAMLAAALGVEIPAPCFRGRGTTTSDGFLMCDFIDSNGVYRPGALAGDTRDINGNLIGLADHLALTKVERLEMYVLMAEWMGEPT